MYLCLLLLPRKLLFCQFLHRSMKACLANLKFSANLSALLSLNCLVCWIISKLYVCHCRWLLVAWDNNNKTPFLISSKIKWVNWKEWGSWNLQKWKVNHSLSSSVFLSLFFFLGPNPPRSLISPLFFFFFFLFFVFYYSGFLCLSMRNMVREQTCGHSGGRRDGTGGEISIDIYTLRCVK